ncbi:MAG: HD domain-containing protein [Oscillospiraceae bacterium]
MSNAAFSLEEVLFSDSMSEFEETVSKFEQSVYIKLWRQAMQSLCVEVLYHSKLHGKGHIERTMLFGALLAMEQSLSRADTGLLLLGCSYHDVGRVSDRVDDDHGARSAKQIGDITGLPEGEDLNILRAMTEAHSLDDIDLDRVIAKYPVKNVEKARNLALLLKDADALDRVRIAHLLDPGYFRFSCSHALLPFAFRFYETQQTLAQRAG